MERQRPRELKEKTDQKLVDLRKELEELREKKKQKELMAQQAEQIVSALQETDKSPEQEKYIEEPKIKGDLGGLEELEARLNKLDSLLVKEVDQTDQQTYTQHAEYIESELQALEHEISTEKIIIEKVTPFEQILQEYPWLEERRYEFMYTIPDKKKNRPDFESWRSEWAKVLFDYAKYAILHIIYVRKMNSEKPFSNFTNREESIKEIADKLIDQKLAKWSSKRKDQLRIYWKTLEGWADEIYDWAIDLGKLQPILIYELREADKEFSNLPKDDIEAIFKILDKDDRGKVIKMDDGDFAFKISVE